VRGIRQLVAASVEGLKADSVVVVDNRGNLLDGADPAALDRKAEIERTVTARVRAMLERLVGSGRVAVVTTAAIDYRKTSETQEIYDKDHAVLRSETRTVEGGDPSAAVGGVAGARGNLPGAPGASSTTTPGAGERLQETKNYEVGRTVRQVVGPDAQLQQMHVAIVVDYKLVDAKPVPRSPEELAELVALARQAAGIDEKRGDKLELRSIPFVTEPDPVIAGNTHASSVSIPPLAIGGAAGVAVVLLLAIMFRRRGRTSSPQVVALPAPIGELERILDAGPSPRGLPAADLPAGRSVHERVVEAVRGDVDRAAGLLISWLAPPKGTKP
jgi:flagellar M-ring protein FliF